MTSPARPTKSQRREDARAQALAMRQEQERVARRQRLVAIVLLVVGLVVVGGVVTWIIASQPDPPPDFSDVENPLSEVATPAAANDEGGIVVGADGVAGAADTEDAVVVTVYSDFMCPVCGVFEQAQGPVLERLTESGDIVVEHRPVAILDRYSSGTRFSTRAATAVALVADQAPESFLAFHDVLFANQPAEGSSGHSDEELGAYALAAGVPQEVVGAIRDGSYMEGEGSFSQWVGAATEQATRDFEQFGTPTILVDGENLNDLEVDWRQDGALEAAIEAAITARG